MGVMRERDEASVVCYFNVKPEWYVLSRVEKKYEYTCLESVLEQLGYQLKFLSDGFKDNKTGFMILDSNPESNSSDIPNLLNKHYPQVYDYFDLHR